MKISSIKTICNKILCFLFCSVIYISYSKNIPLPVESINSNFDEKSIAFRFLDSVTIETWITSSNFSLNPKSKKILIKHPQMNLTPCPYKKINQDETLSKITFDGCITFHNSDFMSPSNYFIFVSNRDFQSKFFNNDLYEGKITSNGDILLNRIDEVNSPYWDDTPFLHPNGKILYFSSDRETPGSGKTDIFISTKEGNNWSTPQKLPIINTPDFSETTPSISPDGKYLYYSTNLSGDYDIWYVEVNEDGIPISHPKQLEPDVYNYVNLTGSDEINPLVSPAGNFLFFSSNRTENGVGIKDYDIFFFPLNLPNHTLLLDVKQQSIRYIPSKEIYSSILESSNANINVISLVSAFSSSVTTDISGNAEISIPRTVSNNPLNDFRFRKINLDISAECKSGEFLKVLHTLKYDALCSGPFKHNVRLWCDEAPPDTIPLPIDSIPFFITGYWCPSTIKYKDYTLCNSFANISKDPEINLITHSNNCNCYKIDEKLTFSLERQNDEFFNYSVEPLNTTPRVIKWRTNNLCIELNELKKAQEKWAIKVDSTLDEMIIQMKKILSYDFVQFEINNGSKVRIEVYGWTDWRPLDSRCHYTGKDINLEESPILIPPKAKLYGKEINKDYIVNNKILKGQKFVGRFPSGNQMLSDLRAYYTADLLNKLWSDNIPEYANLKEKGVINIIAIGKSVKNLPGALEYNRSIDVRFIVERVGKDNFKRISKQLNQNIETWLCPFFNINNLVIEKFD